ncbi:MAG: right-handed parallel beta-helix repeat-containing protein, partial [Candidatus Hydrogenedentota bacterium]
MLEIGRLSLGFTLALVGAMLAPTAAQDGDALDVHVAVDGDDAAEGTAGAPLATLEAARDRVREWREEHADQTVVVHIQGGVYERDGAFELDAQDSGTEDAPVIYRGIPNDNGPARISGGRRLTEFEPVTDSDVLERLPESARDHVLQTDLEAHGVPDPGSLERRGFTQHGSPALELFFDGAPMTLARWPNVGWTTVRAVPDDDAEGEAARTFGYHGDRPAQWSEAADPWVFGYWYHGWADEHLPVEAVDADAREITLSAEHTYGFQENQRFYFYNLLEELDKPGQYYVDRDTNTLYFWPPSDIGEGEAIVSKLNVPLLDIDGASHVRFEHLTFEGSRERAVTIDGGEAVTLAGCAIRWIGRHGVTVSGGAGHRILSSDLYHLGERGIELSGGDRQTLTPAAHEAVNNHIHHFSRWARTYRPAIGLSGVGHRVTNNLIHDAPHMAIGFSGNDHTIAQNRIHHVLTETDDAGAMYIGRNWTERGHVIEHNFIHHSGNQHAPHREVDEAELDEHVTLQPREAHGTNLIYLDDAASGITIRDNVLHDGGRSIMIGGGRDNLAENNLVIGGTRGIWMDGRGLGWAADHIERGGHWGIWDRLEAVPYDEPPYSDRYPGLA